MIRPAWALLGLLVVPSAGAGQLAERVSRTDDGVVRFTYPTRAGVEICDEGVRMGTRNIWWRSRGWDDTPRNCRRGSAEVELRVRSGRVVDVELVRAPHDRSTVAVDVGEVDAGEAVSYLLGLARHDERAAEDAIMPAMLADAGETWRELGAIARDRSVSTEVRKAALFWLGQEAADAATADLHEVARDEDEEQEVRDAAVFALSQRPREEGVPVLMELARTAEHAKTRRTAMFWLAQSDDERVVEFFERVILRRNH